MLRVRIQCCDSDSPCPADGDVDQGEKTPVWKSYRIFKNGNNLRPSSANRYVQVGITLSKRFRSRKADKCNCFGHDVRARHRGGLLDNHAILAVASTTVQNWVVIASSTTRCGQPLNQKHPQVKMAQEPHNTCIVCLKILLIQHTLLAGKYGATVFSR